MKVEIENAIKQLVAKSAEASSASEAIEFTVAALNLASVESALVGVAQATLNISHAKSAFTKANRQKSGS